MCRFSLLLSIAFFLFIVPNLAHAQNSQVVNSGQNTTTITFPAGCNFKWTNDNPSIGLAANGTGDIASFKAINTGTSPITATITATPEPQSLAYVANGQGKLSVIDLNTNLTVATIQVGIGPMGTAINPYNNRVYVVNQQSHTVSVIDRITNTLVTTISTFPGEYPSGAALSPDGTRLYITEHNNNYLTVINTADNSIITSIPIGQNPWGAVVSPDGKLVYVVTGGDNTITVVNTATNQAIASIPGLHEPNDICITPDGKYLYVSNYTSGTLSVINTSTNAISATIEIGFNLMDVAISPDGKKLYVTNSGNNTVSAINTADNTIAATIQVGNLPLGLCFSADGSKVYVINDSASTISVINTSDNTVSTLTGFPLYDSHTFGKFISTTSNCPPVPINYTITVGPAPPPAITTAGNLSPLTTVYGTASTAGSFTVSGTNLVSAVVVTAPADFELSTDGIIFNSSVTIGSTGTLSNATVFVRLAKTTNAGNYNGNITLQAGPASANVIAPSSTVTPAPLVITANDKSKPLGTSNPPLTVSYSGFVNNDRESDLISPPSITTTALSSSPIGTYPIIANGASSLNYIFTYVSGELTIIPADIVVPNIFTPNGDGVNDTWAIKYIEYYPDCKVDIFNRLGTRIFSSIGYSMPWNGKLKDNNLPSGVYYYIIKIKKNTPAKTGWITIIR